MPLLASNFMSITVDYYFNWPGTLSELAAQFHLWIGSDLQPYEGDPENLYCRFLGMEFSLYEHDLENDRELNFEDYRFEAGIRTPIPDNDFRQLQVITMASLVYALYRRLGISEGILVHETELLLARYEQRPVTNREVGLFDSVSGEFVKYTQHMMSLMARIPKGTFRFESNEEHIEWLRKMGYVGKIDGT
jgi:hypothetical protein